MPYDKCLENITDYIPMIPSRGYAVQNKNTPLSPYSFQRRDPGPHDVLIDILYCGICHSDLHQVKNEWGNSLYPMVPGHEIVGKVRKVGAKVTRFKENDLAGVGCLVDACRTCSSCHQGLEQYCENGFVLTYNGYEQDGKTLTFGGYSDCIVVDENFVLKISDKLTLSNTAPLLCAGITTYSPLKHWKAQKGQKVGVMGLGGLGHMAVKISNALGADTVLFTHSAHKEKDALRLGAKEVIITKDENAFKKHTNSFDLIINTVSAAVDLALYLDTLKREGTLVFLGIPEHELKLHPTSLIFKRRTIAGSLIGGIKETQEMLDFCADHNITSDVEIIPIQKVNEAYERMAKGDVKYRFVIDMHSL